MDNLILTDKNLWVGPGSDHYFLNGVNSIIYSPVGPGIGGNGIVIRAPGVGMELPPATGPTGTKGGAKVGIGPIPNTKRTRVIGLYI